MNSHGSAPTRKGNLPASIGEAISTARENSRETQRLVPAGGSKGYRAPKVSRSDDAPAAGIFKTGLAVFTCLFLAWFLFAADFADATAYSGKTKGGSTITFKTKGKRVKVMNTVVPTVCLQTGGGYGSSAGAETYRPKRAVIGRKVKSKALQPAAMHFGVDVTKFYEVKLRRKGRAITGKLKLSYMLFVPDLYNPRTYVCSGSTTFAARPR